MSIFKSLAVFLLFITSSKTFSYSLPLTSYNNYTSWAVDINNSSSVNIDTKKQFKYKRDVLVAVIDTGIDPIHPFLSENIYVGNGKVSEHNYGINYDTQSNKKRTEPLDNHGHGTHVSGIIKSVFNNVRILPIKYYNPILTGKENQASLLKAIYYAISQKVDIINISGGGLGYANDEFKALRLAEKKGIMVVLAAGNEEANVDKKENYYYPASYKLSNMIVVTAHDEDLKILDSSNYGQRVDIAAPGYRIKSSLQNGRVGYLTGTSQSTGFVSGAVALIMAQNPDLDCWQIKEIIKKSAKVEKTLYGKNSVNGRLDVQNALNMAEHSKSAKLSVRHISSINELDIPFDMKIVNNIDQVIEKIFN